MLCSETIDIILSIHFNQVFMTVILYNSMYFDREGNPLSQPRVTELPAQNGVINHEQVSAT